MNSEELPTFTVDRTWLLRNSLVPAPNARAPASTISVPALPIVLLPSSALWDSVALVLLAALPAPPHLSAPAVLPASIWISQRAPAPPSELTALSVMSMDALHALQATPLTLPASLASHAPPTV